MTAHRLTQTRTSDPGLLRAAIFDVYNLIVAGFLFVSPWLFAYTNGTARIEFWASGTLIAAVSAAAIAAFSDWEEWLNLLLGVWLISAPWILGYAHTRAMHVSIGVDYFVAIPHRNLPLRTVHLISSL